MKSSVRQGFRGRRSLAIGVWLCALLAGIAIVARTQFTADMSAFLPRSPTAEQQMLVDQLKDGLVSRLILVGIEGGDVASRADASRSMAQQLRADQRFTTVGNGESGGMQKDQVFLFEHRYQLSPAVSAERFTVDGLRAAVGEMLDLLASPAGLLAKNLLPRDPTGEVPLLLDELAGNGSVNQPAAAGGVWASRDESRAILLVQTAASGSDTDAQQQAIAAVKAAFAKSNDKQTLSLVVTGPGVFAVQARETIQREVTQLSLVSMAIIISLLLIIYRSLTALALGLVPVVSGALAGVVAVSLGFGEVHGLTLGFGTALIGEAVDYSIYLFVQSERTSTANSDWIRRFWPTIRLGVLTSIFGFAALMFSGFPGLAQLGLYSISGLITAALVTRFVLPHMLPAGFQIRDVSWLGARLSRWVVHAGRLRWGAMALLLAASAVLVAKRGSLWSHELSALSPISQAAQMQDATLRADLGAPDVRYLVVVNAPTQEAVLQSAEAALRSLEPLVQSQVITGIDSPTRFLPSMATQQARLATLPATEELDRRLREALAGMPIQPERLAPFLADAAAARAGPAVQRSALDGTSLAIAVDGMLLQRSTDNGEPGSWSALLPLHAPASGTINPEPVRRALAAAATSAAGNATSPALFVDLKGEADQLYAGYLREAIALSLAGFVAIAVLLLITLRSPGRTLRVLLPPAAAIVMVLAGLALAGQRLSILHLVGMLLVVAVGSNYALFFNPQAARPENASEQDAQDAAASGITPRTLASLLFANLTTVAGFGVLALSSVPVLQALGVTVGPGAMLVLAFSAIFARAGTAPAAAGRATLA